MTKFNKKRILFITVSLTALLVAALCVMNFGRQSKLLYPAKLPDCTENEAYNMVIDNNDIDSDSIFYFEVPNHSWNFFDFRKNGTVGIGLDPRNSSRNSYVNTSNTAYTEMYYGLYASITDNRRLNVRTYTHIDGVKIRSISIIPEHKSDKPKYTFENNRLEADLYDDSFTNGLYAINGVFTQNGSEYRCNLYLLVNCLSDKRSDYRFYICSAVDDDAENKPTLPEERQKLLRLLSEKGITPENSAGTNIAYPVEAEGIADFDTEYWIMKSREIVSGYENESKAFRATLIHDWITSNLVYDEYKSHKLGHPRYTNDYRADGYYSVDTNYYVSKTFVGVCRDFTEIYGIMCREQGIPCVACLSKDNEHAWNALYINGVWTEVDITKDVRRTVSSEDVSYTEKPAVNNLHSYTGYFSYRTNTELDHIATQILQTR